MSIFRLTVLPATDGDSMILSWGEERALNHMVIDGGRSTAYVSLKPYLSGMAERGEKLAVYVLTHIDADHIAGALKYLRDDEPPIEPDCVWYNGYRQMVGNDRRSMKQGDDYSTELRRLSWPLNTHFTGNVAAIENVAGPIDIAGLRVTMLSPDTTRLKAMAAKWAEWHQRKQKTTEPREGMRSDKREKIAPMPDPLVVEDLLADGKTDTELANGTSIAFIAEWQERRVLLAGDAHPDLLSASLSPLAAAEGGRYRLDVLKAAHHGSANNTTRELIGLLDCPAMVLSSNGKLHGHPDPQSIARFIHFGSKCHKTLHFNYETDRTRPWGDEALKARHDYDALFPAKAGEALEIDLMA